MLTFRCPGCGKQHVAAEPFENDYDVECLRCAETIHVTHELLYGKPEDTQLMPASSAERGITARPPRGTAKAAPAGKGRRNGTAPVAGGAGEAIADDTELEEPAAGQLAEEDEEENGAPSGKSAKKKKKKPGLPGKPPAKKKGQDELDDPLEPRSPEEIRQEEEKAAATAAEGQPWWKRWHVLAGAGGGLVVVLGVAIFLLFGRGSAKTTPPKPPPRVTKSTPAPQAEPPKEQPAEAPALIKAKSKEIVKVAAVRLASELADNLAETNRKYDHVTLEVSGQFLKLDKKESLDKPAREHLVFIGEGKPVCCDLLASPTDLGSWRRLKDKDSLTVRGIYSKDGFLHLCELLPFSAAADGKYRGKEIEVAGYVADTKPDGEGGLLRGFDIVGGSFPSILLDREETLGLATLECLFRKTDREEVRKVQVGTLITIKGTCAGRGERANQPRVLLHNCEIVYTTAPVPPTPRVSAVNFLREYEEDLRPALLPPPGTEVRLLDPVSVRQLAKEFAADVKVGPAKYFGRLLTVSGRPQRKDSSALILESGDTDQTFTVYCRFNKRNFEVLGDKAEYRIRGFCAGMYNPGSLLLDNCETVDPVTKDDRKVIAEFLPHLEGQVQTYDVAWSNNPGQKEDLTVVRRRYAMEKGGKTETLTILMGTLGSNRSLFDRGEPARWLEQRSNRKVRLPGPIYQHRRFGNYIQIGWPVQTKGGMDTAWENTLKINAKTGDSWDWEYAGAQHRYTVAQFTLHNNRPAVVIQETVVNNGDDAHPLEVRHLYVRDVGEVERQDVLRLTAKDKRVVAEKRLVEDLIPAPKDKPPKDKEPPPPKNKEPSPPDKPPAATDKEGPAKEKGTAPKEPPAKEKEPAPKGQDVASKGKAPAADTELGRSKATAPPGGTDKPSP